MKIFDPEHIEVDAETRQLLAEVKTGLSELKQMGQISKDVEEELRKAFLPTRISDTLNIEGIQVNPRITEAVLEGRVLSETDQYNEREVLNVIEATDLILSEGRSGVNLSVRLINEIHHRVENELIDSAGQFRDNDVRITGAAFQPPPWSDVRDYVGELVEKYNQFPHLDPVLRAAWLHGTFARIHPYKDGNGRTARLLQDFSLISSELLPVGIPANRRREYYESLALSDIGEWSELVNLIAYSELATLEKTKQIVSAPDRRRESIRRYIAIAAKTTKKRDYNRYEVWKRQVELFRDEVERWTQDLNQESEDIHFHFRAYDTISFEKWNEVRSKPHASGTWLFALAIYIDKSLKGRFLFYVRRHDSFLAEDIESLRVDDVGIFLTSIDNDESKYTFGRYDDKYISLREIIWLDNSLVVFEDQPILSQDLDPDDSVGITRSGKKWIASHERDMAQIIERFIEDLLKKMGLI
jgi:Fic family protein